MKKIRDDDRAEMRSNGAVKEGDNAIGKKAVRMVEFAHGMDRPVICHPHGNYCSSGLMNPILSRGIDGFQFAEENDPSSICKLIEDRCVIMGGTDIVPTLFSGTEREICSETETYLKACSGRRTSSVVHVRFREASPLIMCSECADASPVDSV